MSSDDLIDREMTEGYRDGLNPSAPEPAGNRSQAYRTGFLNGREELRRNSRGLAEAMAAPAHAPAATGNRD
jgi:hypothetical protein